MKLDYVVGSRHVVIDGVVVDCGLEVSRAVDWPEKKVVVVIEKVGLGKLCVLNYDGTVNSRFDPPSGTCFQYLTGGPEGQLMVVCTYLSEAYRPPEAKDWADWKYEIDLENKRLVRTHIEK